MKESCHLVESSAGEPHFARPIFRSRQKTHLSRPSFFQTSQTLPTLQLLRDYFLRDRSVSPTILSRCHFWQAPVTTSTPLRPTILFISTLRLPLQAAGSAFETTSRIGVKPFFVAFPHQQPFARSYARPRKMPPKKEVKQEKIPLGRPGNSLKSGIVGLSHSIVVTLHILT